jgi:phosphatidylinositol kinase/protein kinase (PI-3  family)
VSLLSPTMLHCAVLCPQDVALGDVELPGQYLSGLEVNPDSIIYLEGIGADVAIVRRNSSSFRRLSLLCSDGHTRHMLVQVCMISCLRFTDDIHATARNESL